MDSLAFPPLRVLCVDDAEDSAESLGMILELLGCEVEFCYRGAAALVLAGAFHPDVCLVDLNMPEMDGLEVARRLRAEAAGRPLLLAAVTAYGDADSRRNTAAAGFDHHFVKPLDLDVLEGILRGFAAGRRVAVGAE